MADNSNRRALFKNNDRDFETTRRNRNDHSVELRKAKKEDQMRKRRNIENEECDLDDLETYQTKENLAPGVSSNTELTLDQIREKLQSKNVQLRTDAAMAARKQLSKAKNPPIDEFYKAGLIPLLVNVIKEQTTVGDSTEVLVFEASWAVTNIASGDSKHTAAVVDAGAIPAFVGLLGHSSDQVAEQSVWALSNIAGDSPRYRDAVIAAGVVSAVQCILIRFWERLEQLRNVCWLVSNLARRHGSSKRSYPSEAIIELLPLIKEVMLANADSMCVTDLSWALAYACDGTADVIDAVVERGLLALMVSNLAGGREASVITPSLRAVGNVIAGTNEQADRAIKCGVIPLLGTLLTHSNLRIVKETCWVLSNISAGTPEQAQQLVDSNVIPAVLHVLKTGDYKSQKEAVWVISNLASGSEQSHRFYLLNNNVFDAAVGLMGCDDNKVVTLLLDLVRELFAAADLVGQLEQCVAVFESVGGVDMIEQLQNHDSGDIYNKSYEIIKDFLNGDDDEEDQDQYEGQDPKAAGAPREMYQF